MSFLFDLFGKEKYIQLENKYNKLQNFLNVLKVENDNLKIENKKLLELIKKLEYSYNELMNIRSQDKLYKFIDDIISNEFDDLDDFFDELYVHLTCKDRPAYKSAQKVVDAQNIAKSFEKKYLLMKYEYDCLFELFPELENYFEQYEENSNLTLEKVQENYDNVKRYISKVEYDSLSEVERNQLALDRYIESRTKSKWQIGRDYELFIGYEYEKLGYDISYFGIEKKLNDLGRDIIAENSKEILVIQCKYWSKEKVIHEKHLCQLYGTAIQYKKQSKTKKRVVPVFVTQTSLSDTAREFAKDLKIKVYENKKLEEFPRIKCNITKNNEKIYHLPFDQQYDITKIKKEMGESFEFTVTQAVLKGFRRAKKWYN